MGFIYQIKNIITSDLYIGSTIAIKRRKATHYRLLRTNMHHSRYLQNAYNQYGKESFIFEILELNIPNELLIIKEQQYLNNLKPAYNTMKDIKSHIGVKRSPETCKKISEALKGKKLSKKHKVQISKTLTGKIQSIETKLKRSEQQHDPVIQYDLQGNIIHEWKSPTAAALELKTDRCYIYNVIHGRMKTFKNSIWKYKNKSHTIWEKSSKHKKKI